MIYLDNAATTKILDQSLIELNKYYSQNYFNPSAVYTQAIEVKQGIENTRDILANTLKCDKENIIFTSGGTESNNLAILGTVTHKSIGKILCGACEHPAVYNVFNHLKNNGFDVEFIDCNSDGSICEESFINLIQNGDVGFVSIMHVNNETGAINDIDKLSRLAKEKNEKCIFHSDGVQAFMKVKLALKNSNIDFYSISAHKINGSKGVGALYVRYPQKLKSIVFGGGQERNFRSGTENTGGILALKEAVLNWEQNGNEYITNYKEYRDYILNELKSIDKIHCITNIEKSSPHILSLNIENIKGEILLHILNKEGVIIGKGSACSSKETKSRAIKALNQSGEGIIRISFGIFNTKAEIEEFTTKLKESILTLRKMLRR